MSWNSQDEIASWIALYIETDVCIWHLLWKMVLQWGVNLQVILKASEENCWTTWCRTGIIFQTLLYCKPSDRGIELRSTYVCLAGTNASYYLLPESYYIESDNENIRLVKIGITGMSDDLTHDKVVFSNPEFKNGCVKPIAQLNMFNTDGCAAHYKGWP